MKQLITILSLALLVSCGAPPKVHEFENTKLIDSSYDDVWTAAVQFFAENNISVKTIEKVSGIISTEEMSHPSLWMDCGKAEMLSSHGNYRGNFNIFVKEVGAKVSVQVNTSFACSKCNSNGSGCFGRINCNSKGVFEELLLAYINDHGGAQLGVNQ